MKKYAVPLTIICMVTISCQKEIATPLPDCTIDTPISVLVPTGKEIYDVGQVMTIKWTKCNLPSKVDISLHWYEEPLTSNGNIEYAIATVPNTGEYQWSIPHELKIDCESGQCFIPLGYGFKISVSADSAGLKYFVQSDDYFVIN